LSESTRKSRRRKAADRPKKPYPDFPLSPHATGAWQKKIRGKVHYFGKWARRVNGQLVRVEGDGWEDALRLYKEQADDLHAGRTPRAVSGALTVAGLCNAFRTAKLRRLEAGELGQRMYEEYKETCDLIVGAFGSKRLVDDLAADDFEALRADMAKRWGPVRLSNAITRVKSVFKYGVENGLVEKAVRFGSEFKKPGKAVLRRHRAENGEKMLEADEIRRLLGASPWAPLAGTQLRAMILLGINCGFGNADCATLRLSHVDLNRGWINYPRPKTGIPRRCPLWTETVAALREAIADQPESGDDDACGLVFRTERGTAYICVSGTGRVDNVSISFRTLMRTAGLHRDGLGFYTLRHVHRSIADAARDSVACDIIMGHSDPSMAGHYRERVEDDRLRAVVDHVRRWLFGQSVSIADSSNEASPAAASNIATVIG
jgi:integrase